MADDGYVACYQQKLWQLLPGIDRASDAGALREMVNRIGARPPRSAAAPTPVGKPVDRDLRRLGDPLYRRPAGDPPGRLPRRPRPTLDVAQDHLLSPPRRHAGLLEELASDITGRDARVVEFFRRLGRTRHQFDPPIGAVPAPGDTAAGAASRVEGLVGPLTPHAGRRLRRPAQRQWGAQGRTAFDEFFHTADFRRGGPLRLARHPKAGRVPLVAAQLRRRRATPIADRTAPAGSPSTRPAATRPCSPLRAQRRRLRRALGQPRRNGSCPRRSASGSGR